MPDKEELNHSCRAALVCDLGLPRQRCEYRECGKDARSLQYKNDAALCKGTRQFHSERYE